MLSNSYVAEVYYKLNPDEEELNVESWFIKVVSLFKRVTVVSYQNESFSSK